ncbi:B-cell receptor CD22-like [Salvelinus fontinalis]|uniref:B-cell receptor CD22-like n=1 Tax=Salvelinus fontinalis TaxID=8038 RepID=UPI002485CF69|nr:B-cell receptor CD22-like [Salvelinus fontinalis]
MDPTSVSEGERVTLRCRTHCTVALNPTYIWYKNGQRLNNPITSYNSLILDPVTSYNSLILDPVTSYNSLILDPVTSYNSLILDPVTSYNSLILDPVTSYNSLILDPVISYNSLILDPVSSEDAGNYSCAVKGLERILSPEETLTVRYGPRNTSVSVSPSGEIVEGSSVTLTCSSDANPPVDKYTWYKKNGGHYQLYYVNTGPHLVFNHIQSSDTGEYYCEAWTGIKTERSESINIDVKYAPRNTSVSVSPSGEIVEGSSVTLTCSSDANPPVDKYTWYKKNVTSAKASGQSYSITNIISEDRGEYYCEAENKYGRLNSSSASVDVQYGPKNTSVSVSPSGEIVEGSSVTLTCSSDANPPVDKYTWYKKNVTSAKASGQSYSITNIISEDRGEYYCEAQNGRGSMNSTALMIIVAGKQTSAVPAAVRITVVVLVLILCLSGLMCFRKKASKSPSVTRVIADHGQGDSSPGNDNISDMAMIPTAAQTAATDDQDDVHYASVHFSRSKNQEVPLYSTVQLPQPQKEDEDVQYAALKFNLPVLPPGENILH